MVGEKSCDPGVAQMRAQERAPQLSAPLEQWPDHICDGDIRYGIAGNYDGFYLADADHGIPTIGAVSPAALGPSYPDTIAGQRVRVFNYPGQTEAIAAQLVHRWNSFRPLLEALRSLTDALVADLPQTAEYETVKAARSAIAKALGADPAQHLADGEAGSPGMNPPNTDGRGEP